MTHTVTNDLARFGFRELKMAAELLTAYCADKPDYLGDGVAVWMNTLSGNVFLSDEDFNVAMMNGDKLEQWHNCPECGEEGFAEDVDWNEDECKCSSCAPKPKFTSGWNLPGYMPDNDPSQHATFEEARNSLVEDLEWHRDEADEAGEAGAIASYDEAIKLAKEQTSEFTVYAGQFAYWVDDYIPD
jgi:hypothetical protein